MKKLLSRIVCAVAVAAIAAYGVYTHQKETQVSNLTLANIAGSNDRMRGNSRHLLGGV